MKTFRVALLFTFYFFTVHGDDKQCAKEGSSRSPSLKAKTKILCNYDKEYRPVKDQKKAVNISLRLVPKYLDDYGGGERIEMYNWLGVVWKDEFLTWNPSDYNSLNTIHISSDEIWTPDLQHYEDAKTKTALFEKSTCLVTNEGWVRCVIDGEYEAQCKGNLLDWPYDTRNCVLTYTTGVHNASEVAIQANRIIKGTLQANPVWEMLNLTTKIETNYIEQTGQKYNMIKYLFEVKRHSARTESIVFIPAISLIIMTLVPLWLQPTNTERFCLIATNIISHFLFIQHINWIAPTEGHKLPPAVTFFRDSLGLAIAVLIEMTVVKSLLAEKTASPGWLAKPCRLIAGGLIGRTLISENIQEIKDEESATQTEDKDNKLKQIQGERYLIVNVIDRLLFFVLLIAYFVLIILLIPFK